MCIRDRTTANLYLGDPRSGGTMIAQAIVPPIDARDRALVTFPEFQAPPPSGPCPDYPGAPLSCLYVELDPTNSVDEVHENNNIAWVAYSVPEPEAELASALALTVLALVARRRTRRV